VKLYAENPRLRVEISQIEVFESEQRD